MGRRRPTNTTQPYLMKTTLLTAAFSLLALAANAGAPSAKVPAAPAPAPEAFSYNFVEAGWVHVFPDQLDDLDGYYAHLSYSPVNNVFLFAEWGQAFGSEFGADFDVSSLELGAGVYVPVCSTVDFVVTAAALRSEVDVDGFGSADEWGFDASAGFRIRLASKLELGLFYGFTSLDDEEVSSGSAGLVYGLTDAVDLTVRGSFSEDDQQLGVGIRYNF